MPSERQDDMAPTSETEAWVTATFVFGVLTLTLAVVLLLTGDEPTDFAAAPPPPPGNDVETVGMVGGNLEVQSSLGIIKTPVSKMHIEKPWTAFAAHPTVRSGVVAFGFDKGTGLKYGTDLRPHLWSATGSVDTITKFDINGGAPADDGVTWGATAISWITYASGFSWWFKPVIDNYTDVVGGAKTHVVTIREVSREDAVVFVAIDGSVADPALHRFIRQPMNGATALSNVKSMVIATASSGGGPWPIVGFTELTDTQAAALSKGIGADIEVKVPSSIPTGAPFSINVLIWGTGADSASNIRQVFLYDAYRTITKL